ncbi:hypothetical protein AAK913_12595 [Enterococcus faecium]|uniref:hypothetical protein n=1 Tax=Enterococcus faecium TaxID=1352 RepID=UPI003519C177
MKKLGKRRLNLDKKKQLKLAKDKKKTKKKEKRKYRQPADVKLFYRMPLFLVIGIVFILLGVFIGNSNISAYRSNLLANSMKEGEALTVREGNSEGTLTLGNTLLSKDGKTLAVEIQYDDNAHEQLSSFGTNYKLYLIDTKENIMTDVKMSYGLFGTDGSGILTVHSEKGFNDKAFMIFILDRGQLVLSQELMTSTYLTDDEIDRSLAAQLAKLDKETEETQSTDEDEKLPPTYIVRLNAYSAKKALRTWNDDSEMIEDLILEKNLKKLESQKEKMLARKDRGEHTLKEMEKRLQENPKDETAKNSVSNLNSSIQKIDEELTKIETKIMDLNTSTIDPDILDPQQTKFEKFTVINLDRVK